MDESTKENITKIINEILNDGDVIFSTHAREKMAERGYSFADVKHILKNGLLKEIAIHKKQNRYTFCGKGLDDHPGEVIIELRENTGKIIIITVKGGVK